VLRLPFARLDTESAQKLRFYVTILEVVRRIPRTLGSLTSLLGRTFEDTRGGIRTLTPQRAIALKATVSDQISPPGRTSQTLAILKPDANTSYAIDAGF
jgi:hypothetical protein